MFIDMLDDPALGGGIQHVSDCLHSYLTRAHVVEKDCVLGWMLAGIDAHEELAESWLFKGGTCLKKCFFETYRFSEDLDWRPSFRSARGPADMPSMTGKNTSGGISSKTSSAAAADMVWSL
jgi:hypothetical protein